MREFLRLKEVLALRLETYDGAERTSPLGNTSPRNNFSQQR
jgi:hypothetical protein